MNTVRAVSGAAEHRASQQEIMARAEHYSARNYHPLRVVLTRAEDVWVWDSDGRRYLDCLSAYSAVNQGHRHPRIVAALKDQADRLTLTSRAFHNDRMGPFLERLCRLAEMERALPMNTGAEAVETAIKTARKWGYTVKGVAPERAEIVVCRNNFHGRTTTIVGFSSEAQYREGFGPFTPGFVSVDFGDVGQLQAAITPNTVAFLVEPVQGEGGIIVPPAGYLSKVRKLCSDHDVLYIADEIQTGLGRTGKRFAYEHDEDAKPDMLIVGKALGGGVYPVSAVISSSAILGVFQPGDHGSTFGGNPLGAAVADVALQVIEEEGLVQKAADSGDYVMERLRRLKSRRIAEVRGRGLLIGIELKPDAGPARNYCEALLARGLLCKETHERVVRLAPPLTIRKPELDFMLEQIAAVFA
ncbi:MAG: ornithine--oxo-acid transaminase [Gammaproteobacteria bacterium]